MPRPGPSVTSGADLQPGSDSLFPSGFTGGGARPSAGSVGTSEIADGSVSGADLNLASVTAALNGTYASIARTRVAMGALGHDVVAGRAAWAGINGASDGTSTYGNYRSVHTITTAASDLRLVYTAAYANETVSLGNAITVTAAVEYPVGTTTIVAVKFGGRTSVTIDAGGMVISDPLGYQIPAGAVIAVRTYVTPATNVGSGGKWPVGDAPSYGLLNGTTYSEAGVTTTGTVTDQTLSTPYFSTNSSAGTLMFKPVAILGTPAAPPTIQVAGAGDSIESGVGDQLASTVTTYPMAGRGAWRRAINDRYAFLNLSVPGATAQQWAADSTRLGRGPLLTGCTHLISNLGVNDFKSGGRTLSQLQADVLAQWTYAVNHGVTGLNGRSGVIHSTLLPNSTSTDGWATTGNQTASSWEASRVAFNTWLRAGAPIDPTTKAAVAVGTGGALIAGQAGHPLVACLDLAAQVETSLNSGKWLTALRAVTDAAITGSTNTLTSATAAFTSADIGRQVVVQGAGSAGAAFTAVIATITNGTTVTLQASASTTVSGAACSIGGYTYDGTHPTTLGHVTLAAAPAWATGTALDALLA